MVNQTLRQYDEVIADCRKIFENKTKDYSTSWRIFRPKSLTDQIFIKAQRIKTIEEKGTQKIDEDVTDEFKGIINYCIMALVQLELGVVEQPDLDADEAIAAYDQKVAVTKQLMMDKNHDYGEAWRDMRVSSITDIILMKLLRVKQIEDNQGKTIISEGIDANYQDMINYAVFALIKLTT